MTKQKKLDIQNDIKLAPLTTIRLGGAAQHFIICKSVNEIVSALEIAEDNKWPVHILGGGSNTVFSDSGFKGLIIKINLKGINKNDGNSINVKAGENWDEFVQYAIKNGLAGVECLSGIPGLVGASPMQNIGAYGQDASSVIEQVEAIDRRSHEIVHFNKEECNFVYRGSRFKYQDENKYIITSVTFRLNLDGKPNIAYPQLVEALRGPAAITKLGHGTKALKITRDAVISLRKQKSMVIDEDDINTRSCGSFFINPIMTSNKFSLVQNALIKSGINEDSIPHWPVDDEIKIPAAFLIGAAGFPKGYRLDRVGISDNHNLALVNYGGSTKELLKLVKKIQHAVKEKFHLELLPEPVIVD